MRIHRVGITGHRPDMFRDAVQAKQLCEELVMTLKRQYEYIEFNLGGCTGADQWVGDACIEYDVVFNLFLPFSGEIQSKHWYPEQQETLANQIEKCSSLYIAGPKYKPANFFIRNRSIVDNSDFIICFWEGQRRGGTYDAIKYAVRKSKIVLNALTDLSMITGENLRPPEDKRNI